MSLLAPTLQAFFTTRLIGQQQASPHTVAAYRDTLRLLLRYAADHTGQQPSQLDIADLDAPLIGAFLTHLEADRHNSIRTRNARLAAIHSLFRFAALQHPEHADSIQRVLAIPPKRFQRMLVSYLTRAEVTALLNTPDVTTWIGRRDQTLLTVAVQTGLRVGELVTLRRSDVVITTGPHLRCLGRGRKERITPLTPNGVTALRAWLAERQGTPTEPLFPTRRGTSMSIDAVEYLVAKHVQAAARDCPSISGKHVTPHVLRHSCAMSLAEVHPRVGQERLGHANVSITLDTYSHVDLDLQAAAAARVAALLTAPDPDEPGLPKFL